MIRHLVNAACSVLTLACCASTSAQAPASTALDAHLSQLIKNHSYHSVVLAVDDLQQDFTYRGAAGQRRGDATTGMTPDDTFYIASITKPMVAVRVLQRSLQPYLQAGLLNYYLATVAGDALFPPGTGAHYSDTNYQRCVGCGDGLLSGP